MLGVLWLEYETEKAARFEADGRHKDRLAKRRRIARALGWAALVAIVTSGAPPWWVTSVWQIMCRMWKGLKGSIP